MYGRKVVGVIRSTVWIGPDGRVRRHWARVAERRGPSGRRSWRPSARRPEPRIPVIFPAPTPSGQRMTSALRHLRHRGTGPAPTGPHHRSLVTWLWEWTKSIAVALVVWFFLRTFLVEAFRIPSGSMENTLLIGDFLFVNKALYGAEVPIIKTRLPAVREPERNDILVFDSVEEEGLKVVKRLIGMPGDTLAMEKGQLYRNGKRVEEPYAVHSDPSRSEDPIQRAKMREWQLPHLVQRDTARLPARSPGLGADRRARPTRSS